MQADKLRELRELYEAATPGEWRAASEVAADGSEAHIANCGGWSESPEETTQVVCVQVDYTCPADDDARLIAAMHEALPDLLALAEGAEADRADARRWVPVAGYEEAYEVNFVGQVRSLDRIDTDGNRRKGGHLTPYRKGKGYLAVALCAGGGSEERYVHRLVASAFIPNPDGLPQVNHKDGDTANNWAANLEWVTNAENQVHACRVLSRRVRAVYGVSCIDGTRVDFPSLQHAVEAGFVRANIQKCIAGDRGSHRGYRWFDAALAGAVQGEG